MATNQRALQVAGTIRSQIGRVAFSIMGANHVRPFNDSGGAAHGLEFRITRNPERVEWVRVTMDLSDTYSLQFYRITPPRTDPDTSKVTPGRKVIVSTESGVQGDMLRLAIANATGLSLCL